MRSLRRCQIRATFCPASPDGAIVVNRINAVMPIAVVPITKTMVCHVSDGRVCFAMPWVA